MDYVSGVGNHVIRVISTSASLRQKLREINTERDLLAGLFYGGRILSNWKIRFDDDEDLGRLFVVLRDLGFCFLGQPHGWPPAAIFEELRSRGLIDGSFKEISWHGRGRPVLLLK